MSKLIAPGITRWDQVFKSAVDRTDELHTAKWPVVFTEYAADSGSAMTFSSFCSVTLRSERRFYEVDPVRDIIELVVKNTIFIGRDSMNFEVIEWPNNEALVLCKHSLILGTVWVAKIAADTIPGNSGQRSLGIE